MRNLKKILALVLALMMVLSMMVTASAAFSDAEAINADYAEAVEVLTAVGVIRGFENADKTFRFEPNGALNRAQAATMVSYVLEGDLETIADLVEFYENPFTDVPSWAEPYVLYAHNKGVIVGRSTTKYDPTGTITGYELGKMLLIATCNYKNSAFVNTVYVVNGVEYTDYTLALLTAANSGAALVTKISAKSDWQVTVAQGLKAAGIWDSEFKLSKKLTREEACFLVYGAMMSDYDLDANGDPTTKTPIIADTTFGVGYTASTRDEFGRPASEYDLNDSLSGMTDTILHFPVAAKVVYTGKVTAAKVAADLAGYKSGNYYVDADTTKIAGVVCEYGLYTAGADVDVLTTRAGNFASAVAALSAPNNVVEVYVNATTKKVTDVVVITTKAIAAGNVTAATATTPAMIEVDGTSVVAGDLKKGDVVTYVKNLNDESVNVKAATGFKGVLTSYTNAGVYTVNGDTFVMDANVNVAGVQSAIAGMSTAKEFIYYPGNEGTVLYVAAPAGAAPVAPAYDNYVYVLGGWTKATATSSWDSATTYTHEVELKVLKADGTVAYVDLPVNSKKVNNADWVYVTLGDTKTYALPTQADADGLTLSINGVYTVNGDTIVSEFTAAKGTGDKSGYFLTSGTSVAGSLYVVDSDVYLNENTVVVMKDKNFATNGKYVVKTGLASLDENFASTAYVVGYQTYDVTKDVEARYSYVASLIFAPDTTDYVDSTVATLNGYVYVTGDYTKSYVTVNGTPVAVYTYVTVDMTGAYGTATYNADSVTAGFYKVKADGSIDYATGVTGYNTVTGIYGTTLVVEGGFYATSAETVVIDMTTLQTGLKVGATIKTFDLTVGGDGIVDVIFVVDYVEAT